MMVQSRDMKKIEYRDRVITIENGEILIDGEEYGKGNEQIAREFIDLESSNKPRAKRVINTFKRIK
jgi:hypothetical protein